MLAEKEQRDDATQLLQCLSTARIKLTFGNKNVCDFYGPLVLRFSILPQNWGLGGADEKLDYLRDSCKRRLGPTVCAIAKLLPDIIQARSRSLTGHAKGGAQTPLTSEDKCYNFFKAARCETK
jgi:hypothetical protein